jgi:hypothetical protein
MHNVNAKTLVTTQKLYLTPELIVSPGEECTLVCRTDDGRLVVQFAHDECPFILKKDEVRFRWPFAGLGLTVQYADGLSLVMVTDEHGDILDPRDATAKLRRTQALYALAGELAKELWALNIWSREDFPDMLAVETKGELLALFQKQLAEWRELNGLVGV